MNDSSELVGRDDRTGGPLAFPPGDGFTQLEHFFTVEQVLELSEERLPHITSVPGFEVERLASKCSVPFRLKP